MLAALKRAVEKEILIVVISQCEWFFYTCGAAQGRGGWGGGKGVCRSAGDILHRPVASKPNGSARHEETRQLWRESAGAIVRDWAVVALAGVLYGS